MSAIGVVGALFGTILGFFINDYLQKGRQERDWKRQFNAKMFEQVYKKVYDGVNTAITALESKKRDLSMTTRWGYIQKDTSYVVIDDPFRNTMDELASFYNRRKRSKVIRNTYFDKLLKLATICYSRLRDMQETSRNVTFLVRDSINTM